ncbi:NDP-hexose 2,3-dehydratase family protein [Spirillospora sp. NPDC047279]|uniref:NDP-hexose 2,3-dehydratase family protein n=1 Tax=Spirillospora sp. NPDC047279 TaxID=3155478 RepID=UPI00340307B9
MSEARVRPPSPARDDDRTMPARIARSVAAVENTPLGPVDVESWFKDLGRRFPNQVERVPLDALSEWGTRPGSSDIVHRTGRFFAVEGLDVHIPKAPVPRWNQPIINQAEIGILGILAREFDGVLHFLMQAKFEPGNVNGFQLSPTVQATRSNYTRVHRGRPVPYVEYFTETAKHRVIADVRQSEQGSWFHHKRNRNMVVEADDVEAREGFQWLTLGQLHRLFAIDDLVNADSRTVLSCLPFAGPGPDPRTDRFGSALVRSCTGEGGSLHGLDGILSWITDARTRTELHVARIPLGQVRGWHRTEEMIRHESGRYFGVIGVDVTATGREITQWSQPMIEPYGTGVIAFLVREVAGTLHVLMHIRVEPGYVDVLELAPTVQCTPRNYEDLPAAAQPTFLDEVLNARPDQIRFDTVLSEEGGRFHHARNRHLVVEADPGFDTDHPDFRWMTLHQLVDLLRHSHYLNVQARSLIACLHSLSGTAGA